MYGFGQNDGAGSGLAPVGITPRWTLTTLRIGWTLYPRTQRGMIFDSLSDMIRALQPLHVLDFVSFTLYRLVAFKVINIKR